MIETSFSYFTFLLDVAGILFTVNSVRKSVHFKYMIISLPMSREENSTLLYKGGTFLTVSPI